MKKAKHLKMKRATKIGQSPEEDDKVLGLILSKTTEWYLVLLEIQLQLKEMLLSNLSIHLLISQLAFALHLAPWKNGLPWNCFPELAMAFLMFKKRVEDVLNEGWEAEPKPANKPGVFACIRKNKNQVWQIIVPSCCTLQQDLLLTLN